VRVKPLFGAGSLAALLALLVFLGQGRDSIGAQTFNPEFIVTVENSNAGEPSDYTVDFNLPEGDVNFAAVVAFIPGGFDIVPAAEIPIGTQIGFLSSGATLGLVNGACNNPVPVEFEMLNGSINTGDTVSFFDTDESATADFAEDGDGNGIVDAVDRYPDFLNRLFPGLTPLRRAAGVEIVAGTPVLLQFLVFSPGTVINPDIPSDAGLGYPSVTVLQNIGDPEADPMPGVITDFCTPLTSSNTTFGAAEDGTVLARNPATPGDYTFTVVAFGQRDADGDGYENGLDTCPFDPNAGNPRILGDGDLDNDGLDAACDPNDNDANSDQDGDGYLNRQDNCPQVANGQEQDNQADRDRDQIGDACDPNPDTPDGELSEATLTRTVTITAVAAATPTPTPAPGPGVTPAPTPTPRPGVPVGPGPAGVGSLAPANTGVPLWAALLAVAGVMGLLGGAGLAAARLRARRE
jgi:hypothetical protein